MYPVQYRPDSRTADDPDTPSGVSSAVGQKERCNMTTTLHTQLDYLNTLTITDPLAAAKAEYELAKLGFEAAKADFDDATAEAQTTVTALIRKANEQNRKAAEAAQTKLTEAKAAYEAAQTSATAAAEKVHALEKGGAKAVSVTGADKIQLCCGLCCLLDLEYDQEELVKLATELTGKQTIGQYGYFRRLTKLFKLYGIKLTVVLPEPTKANN
jgi:hypothetical protein